MLELIEDDNDYVTPSPTSVLSTPNVEFRTFLSISSTPKSAELKSDANSTTKTEDVKSNGKRASVIDPPYHFQDNRASRDLIKEFELLESLINNNVDSDPSDKPPVRCGDYGFEIDPKLINEQDNLIMPDRLPSADNSPLISRRPTRLAVKPSTRALPLISPDQVRLAPDGSSAESQTREGRRASPWSGKTQSKMKIDFSPDSLRTKNDRRTGTSGLSKQAGLEIKKVTAEGLGELSPKVVSRKNFCWSEQQVRNRMGKIDDT